MKHTIAKDVDGLIAALQRIESNKEKGARYITSACFAYSNREHQRLGFAVNKETGEISSTEQSVSDSYYLAIMNEYRSIIKSFNYKHHMLEHSLDALLKKHADNYPELPDLLSPDNDLDVLRNNISYLMKDYDTYKTLRDDLKKLRIEHHLFYSIQPKAIVLEAKRTMQNEALDEKMNSIVRINPTYVIELINSLLNPDVPNSSYTSLAVGIALATGRRLTEVIKTAEFEKVGKLKNTLKFTGQLKTKDRHLFDDDKPYTIRVLVDNDIVLNAFARLRKLVSSIDIQYSVAGQKIMCTVESSDKYDIRHNYAVSDRFDDPLNQRARGILGSGKATFKDTRAIYVEVAYHLYKRKGESKEAFRARMLGHIGLDKISQLHYVGFECDDSASGIEWDDRNTNAGEQSQQEKSNVNEVVAQLALFDAALDGYRRAPNLALIHAWLKNALQNGLSPADVNVTYLRKNCIIDNKSMNPTTISKYLDEVGYTNIIKMTTEKEK